MLTRSATTYFLAGLMATTSHATASLCSPTEEVVFSCSSTTKTISLCASSDLSSSSGYMQYRLGTKAEIDLVFPEARVHPRGHFSQSSVSYSSGASSYLSFVNGHFRYLLYDVLVAKSPPQIGHYHGVGVVVLRNALAVPIEAEWPTEAFVSILRCDPATVQHKWIPASEHIQRILEHEDFYYFPTQVIDAILEERKWK